MTAFLAETHHYRLMNGQFYPLVTVFLHKDALRPRVKSLALIDSGATISIFQKEIAKQLGITINKGEPIDLEGVGGKIQGYVHQLSLKFSSKTIKIPVVFSDEFEASVNLLGRQGFFESYTITFKENKKQLSTL